MPDHDVFAVTEADLLPILAELSAREPIFHRPEFASDHYGFERMTDPAYWEVGASGQRYSRSFILHHLEESPPVDAQSEGWRILGHALRRLGPDTYLLTYNLKQGTRLTRRATIWRKMPDSWQSFITRAP
jgi:hypothetical protein